jgi:hypothetical protein
MSFGHSVEQGLGPSGPIVQFDLGYLVEMQQGKENFRKRLS